MEKKYEYDSPSFHGKLYNLCLQGYTDREIAQKLKLDVSTFSRMKNGKSQTLTPPQNIERSQRIRDTMARGRRRINAIVRFAYLRAALGGTILHSTIRQYLIVKDADGREISRELLETKEIERELPSNIHLLDNFLTHFDDTWREDIRSDEKSGETETQKWVKEKISINVKVEK